MNDWDIFKNENGINNLPLEQQWKIYNQRLNEMAVASSSAAGAGSGGNRRIRSNTINLTMTIPGMFDGIFIYASTYDDTDILIDWGDGNNTVLTTNNGVVHDYSTGTFILKISNNVNNLQIYDESYSLYSVIGKNDFKAGIHLTNLTIGTQLTEIIDGAFDNCPLQYLTFKWNRLTNITRGMFSNIETLESLWLGENPDIQSVESGSFEIPTLKDLYFYCDFANNSITDSIIMDLYSANVTNLDYYSYTCYSGDVEDIMVEMQNNRGCNFGCD